MIDNNLNRKIIEFIMKEDGAFYGNLVMELDEDPQTILEHLIHLKKKGLVFKDLDGGKFRLSGDAAPGTEHASGEGAGEKWDIVDEINRFSEKTYRRDAKVDNEISINKQVPGEQKVKPGNNNNSSST